MANTENFPFETAPEKIRRAFDRAAPAYDAAAELQREVNRHLIERLADIDLNPARILDLGAGTGTGSLALKRFYPHAQVLALDFAQGMLRQLQGRTRLRLRKPLPVCADIGALPLRDACVDLIYSSLTLQWHTDLPRVFAEARRVLKPGGAMLFATLGPDTLQELRASWAAVDAGRHVNNFLDMHDVGDAVLAAGFADPVLDVDYITLHYPVLKDLLRGFKTLGANTVPGRPAGLTGKQRFAAMCGAYESFRTADGLYPATYEIVFGLAWGRDDAVRPLTFMPQFGARSAE